MAPTSSLARGVLMPNSTADPRANTIPRFKPSTSNAPLREESPRSMSLLPADGPF